MGKDKKADVQEQQGRQVPVEEILAELGDKVLEIRLMKQELMRAVTAINAISEEKKALMARIEELEKLVPKKKAKK